MFSPVVGDLTLSKELKKLAFVTLESWAVSICVITLSFTHLADRTIALKIHILLGYVWGLPQALKATMVPSFRRRQ